MTSVSTFRQLPCGKIIRYCMPLAPGTRLGPYEILAPIGAGGMGEVYKARDTRLDRTVAIKVSQAGSMSALSAKRAPSQP